MHVLLIGARGAGKSTIGRQLSQRTGIPFIDLDERTRARFDHQSVTEIWVLHGEAAWRAAEADALATLLEEAPHAQQIIALGGGTPTVAQARASIDAARRSDNVRVIYLACDAGELERRLRCADAQGDDRPPLTRDAHGGDAVAEVRAVLAERDPIYQQLADLVIDVTTCTVEDAVERAITATGLPRRDEEC